MPGDVASFNGTTYSRYFSGSDNSVPPGAAIDAVTMIGGNLALSFDIPVALPGPTGATFIAYPADLVQLTGSNEPFQTFFSGKSNGVPPGVNLVGADYLASDGHLLLVFDGTGSVGGENFTPQDVLEFDPSSNGWSLAYDAETAHPGFAPAHLQGVFALEPTPSPTVSATATMTATVTSIATPTTAPTVAPTPTMMPTATPTIVAVNVDYSPVHMDFPNEAFGVSGALSPEQYVTLQNPMNKMKAAIVFGAPQTSSNEFEVTSNSCPPNLAPGKSCKIGVRFVPAALGRRTGSLEIANNARNSPQRVSLVGMGVRPVLRLRPDKLTFGRWQIGVQSSSKTIAIINRSAVPIEIESVAAVGKAGSEFIVTSGCPSPLAALAQCSLNVSFKPAKKGLRTARITITDAARGNPQVIYLYGTGKE
ncbi:MAG TPA: choice-of-anchor D domain-containing protein [Candidatus Binataceae bacterium]|nr:choice-of-anchor D domain-containing protein [Candidatus Binataceae bacterium]